MADVTVRNAQKGEIPVIAGWLMEERARDPRFRQATQGAWRRWLYRRFAIPRYLRSGAHTWVLEEGGEMAGYAVVEQRSPAVYLAEIAVREGFDRPTLTLVVLQRAEAMARDVQYAYLQAAPLDYSEAALAPYRAAGFDYLDYYLWAFSGSIEPAPWPGSLELEPLTPAKAVARRLDTVRQELDASEVAGRDLIDATFLHRRPAVGQAFEIQQRAEVPEGIGYLEARPNERGDGVLTLVLSLLPEHWESHWEAQIARGFAGRESVDGPGALRLLLSTTAHCDQAEKQLQAIGLSRMLDHRPILFKEL